MSHFLFSLKKWHARVACLSSWIISWCSWNSPFNFACHAASTWQHSYSLTVTLNYITLPIQFKYFLFVTFSRVKFPSRTRCPAGGLLHCPSFLHVKLTVMMSCHLSRSWCPAAYQLNDVPTPVKIMMYVPIPVKIMMSCCLSGPWCPDISQDYDVLSTVVIMNNVLLLPQVQPDP